MKSKTGNKVKENWRRSNRDNSSLSSTTAVQNELFHIYFKSFFCCYFNLQEVTWNTQESALQYLFFGDYFGHFFYKFVFQAHSQQK